MNKKMSIFSFFTFTSAMVISVYVYPTLALSGLSLIFFLFLSVLLWFLPTALCSAEMASVDTWKSQGLFTWVEQTLGKKWAFCAVFYQWFQISIGFISMLYFIIGMISVALQIETLNTNPILKLICMLVIFYAITFLQFFGDKVTTIISKIGFFLGVLLPALFLISICVIYVTTNHPIQLDLHISGIVPDLSSLNTLVVFSSFILAYLGIEASAVQINHLQGGKKSYPRVMIVFCIVSLLINMLAALAIALVVPSENLSLSTGMTQAVHTILLKIAPSLLILVNTIAMILTFSTIAKISTWIVAPAKELLICVEENLLPKALGKTNSHNVPTRIVIIQTIIASFWAIVITLLFDGNNIAFFLSLALTVIIYIFAYILMYIAYFKLQKMDTKRSYKVHKNKMVRYLYAGIGFFTTLFTLCISFLPPSSFSSNKDFAYIILLICSSLISFFIPLCIYKFMKRRIKS